MLWYRHIIIVRVKKYRDFAINTVYDWSCTPSIFTLAQKPSLFGSKYNTKLISSRWVFKVYVVNSKARNKSLDNRTSTYPWNLCNPLALKISLAIIVGILQAIKIQQMFYYYMTHTHICLPFVVNGNYYRHGIHDFTVIASESKVDNYKLIIKFHRWNIGR